MPTCGSCKLEGQTVEHVKICYEQKRATITADVTGFAQTYVQSSDFRPMALVLPDSKYARVGIDGQLRFYEVRTGKGKWAGFQFLDLLVGAPGEWRKLPIKGEEKKAVLAALGTDPKAAAVLYSKEFTVCAVCGSPLSDPESLATGLGPICARRF